MEDSKPPVREFDYRDETLYKALFGISEDQYSNASNKLDFISIQNIFTTKKIFMELSIEELKPVVMGDRGG